ncbi:helix-turn-helix domain-containing protein [Burkholderia anthina]|uniref:helix-turn-helix domain-containing protein n=1 Tax=Burkholderia anthina TaxID=179879 RepID=UPI0037BE869E
MNPAQDNLIIAQHIGQAMDRLGIPRSKQTRTLAEMLELSFAQAHRKMKGQSNWTIVELHTLSNALSEPVTSLIDPRQTPARAPHTALFDIGSRLVPCLAWIGDEIAPDDAPEFVAVRAANVWQIHPADQAPTGRQHAVEQVEIRPRHHRLDKPAVAVVDDDGGMLKTADMICLYLNDHGFDAQPYYDAASFRHAIRHIAFDAFVLDWQLDTETAEAAISEIRLSGNAQAPILLLTGQLEAGHADESDIANVMTSFDVSVLEKPARMPLLMAALNKKLVRS